MYNLFKCDKVFYNSQGLDVHFRRAHDDKKNKFHCKSCSNKFQTKKELEKHEKVNCETSFNFFIFIFIFLKLHLMDLLASTDYENGSYFKERQCSICHKVFNYLGTLVGHWDRLHQPKPSSAHPYACGYCHFQSQHERKIRRHLLGKHPEFSIEAEIDLIANGKSNGRDLWKAIYVKARPKRKSSVIDQEINDRVENKIELKKSFKKEIQDDDLIIVEDDPLEM
jgi:hypothetical protein